MSLPTQSFFFLRHGQTDWNAQGRFQGHTDIPLNAIGIAQAHAAAQRLAKQPIDAIIASPLARARKTAEIIAAAIDKPITFDEQLKERHFGGFEGLVVNEVKASFGLQPHQRLVQHLPADAEQWHETRSRTVTVISKWLDHHRASKILFVAHSGLFDALHELLFDRRIEPKHVPYHWSYDAAGWRCEEV